MRQYIYKAWVNQPSKLQENHHLHGRVCTVVDDCKDEVLAIFDIGWGHFKRHEITRIYNCKAEQDYFRRHPICPDNSDSKINKLIDLIDNYLWYTGGCSPDDDYSIRDEDDFDEFKKELTKCLDNNN